MSRIPSPGICFDRRLTIPAFLTAGFLLVTPALAAEPGRSGHSEVTLLAQIVVLLAAGRLLGE